eukprot:1649187-Karenia_brevis.AAC.1
MGMQPALKNAVDAMTVELERFSPQTRKSPPLLRSMIRARELLVINEDQLRYLRAYTRLKPVRVWAALRSDD